MISSNDSENLENLSPKKKLCDETINELEINKQSTDVNINKTKEEQISQPNSGCPDLIVSIESNDKENINLNNTSNLNSENNENNFSENNNEGENLKVECKSSIDNLNNVTEFLSKSDEKNLNENKVLSESLNLKINESDDFQNQPNQILESDVEKEVKKIDSFENNKINMLSKDKSKLINENEVDSIQCKDNIEVDSISHNYNKDFDSDSKLDDIENEETVKSENSENEITENKEIIVEKIIEVKINNKNIKKENDIEKEKINSKSIQSAIFCQENLDLKKNVSTICDEKINHDFAFTSNSPKCFQNYLNVQNLEKTNDINLRNIKLDALLNSALTDNGLTDEIKLNVVCSKIIAFLADNTTENIHQYADCILKLLISEDMQKINNSECLKIFFANYFKLLPKKLVAEILSVFIAVLKKSLLNIDIAKDILFDCIKLYIEENDESSTVSDNLIKHFLREIIGHICSYSCNVKELKKLLNASQNDSHLLTLIRNANLHQRNIPSSFFNFPGSKGSVLALPPVQKWPIQNGWTFICWFRSELNPVNSQPYLYFFRSSKSNIGYSAHFTGNCLVLTSMKVKNKMYQHCIPYEFVPFKWYHCAISYISKWRTSEIKVYVNGQLTANNEMPWQVQTQDVYDKCFIGGTSETMSEAHLFCGQISAIYLFHEALNPSQICAIHRLGPNYMGQYKYANEMFYYDTMPPIMKKVLYEEKLSSTLFSLYTPVAIEGDTLCLQSAPRSNTTYFTSSPHAALLGNARAIITSSINSTLQSIGGVKALLPLLNKFSGCPTNAIDTEACSTIIGFICDLLEASPHWFGNEVVQSHAFVIISSLLMKNARLLINETTLDIILNLTKTLMSASLNTATNDDSILLKQLMDSILFNPSLWIYVNSKLQIRLYCYLATEFLSTGAASSTNFNNNLPNIEQNNNSNSSNSNLPQPQASNGVSFSEVRRISTVLQLLHSLKYYYWLVAEDSNTKNVNNNYEIMNALRNSSISSAIQPIQVKARDIALRPCKNDLITIRSYILLFIKQLIIRGNGVHNDELQAILNYLTTVFQSENLLDVLQMLQSLMVEHPASMIPAFDAKHGIKSIFKLLKSFNEEIRIHALKLLGYFLSRSVLKRKADVMGPNNLFMLLYERMMKYSPLTIDSYNALLEILVETPIETIRSGGASVLSNLKIENPIILKVISTIIIEGMKESCSDKKFNDQTILNEDKRCNKDRIKKMFINDLWKLLVNSRDNRRLVLQMSVWQNWLINLIDDKNDQIIADQILTIFRVLLYHAIKYEYGGWRVWIDTLAIIHAKVSLDEFMCQFGDKKLTPSNTLSNTSILNKLSSDIKLTEDNKSIINSTSFSNDKFLVDKKLNSNNLNNEDYEKDETDINKIESHNLNKKEESVVSTLSPGNQSPILENNLPDSNQTNENEEVIKIDNQTTGISTIVIGDDSLIHKYNLEKNTDLNVENQKNDYQHDDIDVAPTRIFRKNSTKDFYSNLLMGGQQQIGNNSKERKFVGVASTTPAFRIPEFKWSSLHLKLLNDLLYSIECDLQMWRSQGAKDIDKDYDDHAKILTVNVSATHLDQILQNPDNQIYIVNCIHLISQLCDNIIIASGGLLPLLASATGGNSANNTNENNINRGGEGLTSSQANSLLYRLVNLADILCFAATHINFTELEAEKNMSPGGILEQCLRLVCTVAVKNCLIVQKHQEENINDNSILEAINQKNIHNLGVSISSAAELFNEYSGFSGTTCSGDETSSNDSIDIHINDTQPELFIGHFPPLQPLPIKDLSKLLQEMDVNRLRACIYRDADADAKQSQFLALATLYFISVLMVSKYRDIIEPKFENRLKNFEGILENELCSVESSEFQNRIGVDPANIGDILTSKLESTLSSVCPLLKEIMCDFASFLSKKLVGSHGQDLVSKEIVRTFKRTNASPVELVMLLCSQEWQNTLQKNAGLAFIELINRGRILSHSMKDHIVRVAMEAEFILNRLRADDVIKHEEFNLSCLETMSARNHKETLINSLITSVKHHDRMLYARFKENLQHLSNKENLENIIPSYKLDTWEDDCRRKRRFILNPFTENQIKVTKVSNENTIKNQQKINEKLSTPILIPNNKIICKENFSTSLEEENDIFLWDSDEVNNSAMDIDDDRERTNTTEFVETVLYTVNCSLIWSIYAIEGTLQITENELIFEATNFNFDSNDGSSFSKSKMFKCNNNSRPNSGNLTNKTNDNLKNLLGSTSNKTGKGIFKDLDFNVLRYCDLLCYNGKIQFDEIRAVFSRSYLLQQVAIEIILAQRTSVMFAFSDFETVKKVVKYLPPVGVGVKYGVSRTRRASLMSPKQLFSASNMTQKWQKREITNFEYLMFLNTIAGRTYQDLNQYPIFPWILTNYESDELDLSQPTNFRDLSKPIGALNSERRNEFIERYNNWDSSCLVTPFHYGTHYSTAAFTLSWLIRLEPFYSAYLALHDGVIEDKNRLFTSISDSWIGSLMGGQQNVKELIPEFFYLPEILTGTEFKSDLGNVKLPKWAHSEQHFIRLHRMALESDLVSCQLHQWIDLIFGYKQRGPEAVRAVNVFYYLTYEGNVDLSSTDPCIREAIEAQIRHFGQTPSQLTTEPHPPRNSALHVSPLMFNPVMDEVCMSIKFPFNASITHIAACSIHNSSMTPNLNTNLLSTILTINSNLGYHLHKWNSKESSQQPFTVDSVLINSTNSNTTLSSSSNIGAKRQLQDLSGLCTEDTPQYIVTLDAKHIIIAPFFDNSMRVYSTETGKITQIVYGHRAMLTRLCRSECNVLADFYIASGSKDCSILLWTWNAKYCQIEGNNTIFNSNNNVQLANPLPKLTLTGHENEIKSLLISAELGLIVSGSLNLILIHTTTNGDIIGCIDIRNRFKVNLPLYKLKQDTEKFSYFKDTAEASIEASIVGKSSVNKDSIKTSSKTQSNSSEIQDVDQTADIKNQLSKIDTEDYYINNLVLSRELAFIIGIGIPKKCSTCKVKKQCSSTLLFTYNLRGQLMKCTSFPSIPLFNPLLTITRDGEYIILTENHTTIKIIRSFDLTPLYALNVTDFNLATNAPSSEEVCITNNGKLIVSSNKAIRSILLLDYKYLLVGLDSGKMIIYNIDFNRWHHEYSCRY